MRDYEILIVVFTVMAIIVSILIEYIKKRPPLYQSRGHLFNQKLR